MTKFGHSQNIESFCLRVKKKKIEYWFFLWCKYPLFYYEGYFFCEKFIVICNSFLSLQNKNFFFEIMKTFTSLILLVTILVSCAQNKIVQEMHYTVIDTVVHSNLPVLLLNQVETNKKYLKYGNDTLELIADNENDNIPFSHRFTFYYNAPPVFIKSKSTLAYLYKDINNNNDFYFPYKISNEWIEKIADRENKTLTKELIIQPLKFPSLPEDTIENNSKIFRSNLDNDEDIEMLIYIAYKFDQVGFLYFIDKYENDWYIIDRFQQIIDDEMLDHTPTIDVEKKIVLVPNSGHGSSSQSQSVAILRINEFNVYECIQIITLDDIWDEFPVSKTLDSKIDIQNTDTINVEYTFSFFASKKISGSNEYENYPYIIKEQKQEIQFIFNPQKMIYTPLSTDDFKIDSSELYIGVDFFIYKFYYLIDRVRNKGTSDQKEFLLNSGY